MCVDAADWRRWLREWRDALQRPTAEGGAAFSSVTPLQPQSYFHFVGDVTVDDLLVGLDQDLPAPAPLPPPPPPTPPPPPPQGGGALVALGCLPFYGSGESAYSSYSSANSWLHQLEGGTSWEELLMNLPALVPPAGAQIHLPELPALPHAGDEIHMLDLPALPPAGDENHMPVLPAPPAAGDEIDMPELPAPLPDDAMAGVVPMIGHAVPVASGGDDRELVGADSMVSGDSDGISADAGSSSDSLEDLWWCQILGAEGTSSTTEDDNFSGLPSPTTPSAGRRWPVVAPGESIGVDVRPNGTWEAHIWLKNHNIERSAKPKNGMQFFVGSFGSEDEAKCAHDQAAIMLGVRVTKNGTLYSLNHPEEQYASHIAEHAGWSRRDYMWKMRRYSGKFSKGLCDLKGVAQRKAARWSATISVSTMIDGEKRKTTMAIGQFKTKEEAGREYDKALLFIKGAYDPGCITNFRPSTYSAAEVQQVGERLAAAYPKVNFQELRRKHSGVFA
jgi:hypothetical protein